MKRTFSWTIACILLQCGLYGQETILNEPSNDKTLIKTQSKVIINQEMIKRFNDCGTEGEYLSWRDLVTGFDNRSLADLYTAYLTADFDKETLAEIKQRLEVKHSEHLQNIEYISDSELDWYNQVKQEISTKLSKSSIAAYH